MTAKPRPSLPTPPSGTVTFLFTDIEGSPGLDRMKVSPQLRSLHGDPRWQPFVEKMGFAEGASA